MFIPRDSPIPPSGYHFIDRSGGSETRIEGSSYADTAKNVLGHRLRNGKPPGNPLQELYDYVCGNWKHLCNDSDPARAPMPPGATLAHRTSEWIGRFVNTTGADAGVEQPEANRRAEICTSCPQNQNYRGGCGSCVQATDQASFIYRHNRSTPFDSRLGACQILDEHLTTSIWGTKLGRTDKAVPDFCWRRAS